MHLDPSYCDECQECPVIRQHQATDAAAAQTRTDYLHNNYVDNKTVVYYILLDSDHRAP